MAKAVRTENRKFLLLDANVVAGYYLPEALSSTKARDPIKIIIESVSNLGRPDIFLYIPSLCIPEVFSVFAKYHLATWDNHIKKVLPRGLTKNKYQKIRKQFRDDIRNGALLQPVELTQYHIQATNLISPVDANFEHYRTRSNKKKRRPKKMMGAADHTIIGMGIQLSKIHGRDNFAIVTADNRLADILTKATSVNRNTAKRIGLIETANELDLDYGPNIYPDVINLAKITKGELAAFFQAWPLPASPPTGKPLSKLTLSDAKLLSDLRKKRHIGRDRLPYTQDFEIICHEFERLKGHLVDRHAVWTTLSNYEKNPKKKKKKSKK